MAADKQPIKESKHRNRNMESNTTLADIYIALLSHILHFDKFSFTLLLAILKTQRVKMHRSSTFQRSGVSHAQRRRI